MIATITVVERHIAAIWGDGINLGKLKIQPANSKGVKLMKNIFKFKIVLLLVILFSVSGFGQTPVTVEKELVSLYAKVNENSAYKSDTDYDLLQKANDNFKAKMLESTKIAATLKHNFSELGKEITITTSEDGKFRAYSWDRLDGGTMHFFETVYQFQGTDGKVYSQSVETEEGNAGGYVKDIFSVNTKQGSVYLVVNAAIGSTQDRYEGVGLFKIVGNKLDDKVKLFKTKSGLTNSIGFGYNFFSVVDRKERPPELILYDKKTKILKIPVVIEDKEFMNGKVTNRFINYKFNGTNFVKIS